MASPSVSFRISRSAEDLAETIHALSHRLVKLEQRFEALELRLEQVADPDPRELESLENAERLLLDCRDLLAEGCSADPEPGQGSAAAQSQPGPLPAGFHPRATLDGQLPHPLAPLEETDPVAAHQDEDASCEHDPDLEQQAA